jgi:hypothetical protein
MLRLEAAPQYDDVAANFTPDVKIPNPKHQIPKNQ